MTGLKIKYLLFALLLHAGASCQIASNEIARVNFKSSGCFHAYEETLIIYKDQGGLKARLESRTRGSERIITEAQYAYFNQFIEELKNLKAGGLCTTVQTYKVYIRHSLINKEDGSCDWYGFDKLYKKLFAP